MMMETEDENEKDGSNPHPAIGSAQHLQQQRQRQQEHFGSSGLGIMATTSIDTIHTAAIPPHRQPQTLLFQKPTQFTASYNYGDMIRVLDFTELHSILNDKFLAHVLPCVKSLQELIIVSPNQLSDESLFAIGSNCRRLVRLELRGCTKVSDKGTEAVFGNCVKLRTVVLANVVGNSSGSSRASSSNNSLALTHSTLDHLSNHSNKAPTIKLHTLNLANGLRFPTSGQVDPLSAQSLTNLIHTHTLTLVSVTLSFCGPAVTDTVLSHFSTSLLHLNLAFCFEVTDAGITALARTSPNLQDLDITGLTQVSDKGILAIGQHCPDFWQLAMIQQQQQQGRGGQWANQNPLITDEVLNCFPWGARIVQRRDELLGQKKSPRIF
ncbi:hypothetical protein BGX23_004902 [Mortierella sp. AD031]|nr:hypothetical protein BGX23_004902 [Mortierella sp. AD031]